MRDGEGGRTKLKVVLWSEEEERYYGLGLKARIG